MGKEFRSRIIINDEEHINRLISGNRIGEEKRSIKVLSQCGNDFLLKLRQLFGDHASDFYSPRVITGIIHSGSTIRTGCTSKTKSGAECSIRVTIGAVKEHDSYGKWVLETIPLNIDRISDPCEDCKGHIYNRGNH